jgi:hypothetical protein
MSRREYRYEPECVDAITVRRIIRRTVRQLERDGVLIKETEQPYLDLTQADLQDSFTVNRDGFSLNAG